MRTNAILDMDPCPPHKGKIWDLEPRNQLIPPLLAPKDRTIFIMKGIHHVNKTARNS